MDLYYATGNKAKILSLQKELDKYDIKVVQVPLDIPEPRSNDVKEIAEKKIMYAYAQLRSPVVALDAGFYIHSLNGFPRAFVNFALETIGLEGILKLAQGLDRSCEFLDCMAYIDNKVTPQYFMGHVEGKLATEQRGVMQDHLWSKLGLIFIPEGSEKTLAEMTLDEYNAWRKISREKESPARQFAEWYVSQQK